jgi:hypothetical protein
MGLAWAAWREGKRWNWFLVCMVCSVLEPLRQRGDSTGMPYPFILAAPLAALGIAYAVLRLAEAGLAAFRERRATIRTVGSVAALGLTLFLCGQPAELRWMDLRNCDPLRAPELMAFLDERARPGDLICGLATFDWDLPSRLRACEPGVVGAAQGRACGLYGAGAPASRFSLPCRVDDLRFAVVTRAHLLSGYQSPGMALTFLEMESQGWPLVFDDHVFKVFENPRFGIKPDPGTRIVMDPRYYQLARDQARQDGRLDLERFADARLGGKGDRTGRWK